MYIANEIVLLLNGFLLAAGLIVLILTAIARYKFNLKKIRTQEQLLIAEIKRRKQMNSLSLQYSSVYDQALNALLEVLEEEREIGLGKTKRD